MLATMSVHLPRLAMQLLYAMAIWCLAKLIQFYLFSYSRLATRFALKKLNPNVLPNLPKMPGNYYFNKAKKMAIMKPLRAYLAQHFSTYELVEIAISQAATDLLISSYTKGENAFNQAAFLKQALITSLYACTLAMTGSVTRASLNALQAEFPYLAYVLPVMTGIFGEINWFALNYAFQKVDQNYLTPLKPTFTLHYEKSKQMLNQYCTPIVDLPPIKELPESSVAASPPSFVKLRPSSSLS